MAEAALSLPDDRETTGLPEDDEEYEIGEWWSRKGPTPKRPLHAVRCDFRRSDGSRCRAWSVRGLAKCVTHSGYKNLPTVAEYAQQQVESARLELLRLTPAAVNRIEKLIEDDSTPHHVQLKASTEVLDRIGVRGGTELTVQTEDSAIDPVDILRSKLDNLASRARERAEAEARTIQGTVIQRDEPTQNGQQPPPSASTTAAPATENASGQLSIFDVLDPGESPAPAPTVVFFENAAPTTPPPPPPVPEGI